MDLSRVIANNIYTICGTPSLERRYPAFWNGGFTAQEYSASSCILRISTVRHDPVALLLSLLLMAATKGNTRLGTRLLLTVSDDIERRF